jgi:hypothetical protein
VSQPILRRSAATSFSCTSLHELMLLNSLSTRGVHSSYDKAIEINPQDANAWYNKGITLKTLGRTTEADAAFAKAKDLTTSTTSDASSKSDANTTASTVPVHNNLAKLETVSMGPYNVSFDLGTVNHTIEVYPPQHTGTMPVGLHVQCTLCAFIFQITKMQRYG